jgi:hypothetical protein
MNGKYYAVYQLRTEDEPCIGTFESTQEVSDFLSVTRERVWLAITRKNPIAIKKARYWIEVYKEPTTYSTRLLMRERFGYGMYKISSDGIYIRQSGIHGWQFFAADFEEAAALCS